MANTLTQALSNQKQWNARTPYSAPNANKEANLDSYRTPSSEMDYGYQPPTNTTEPFNDPSSMDYSFDSAGIANRANAQAGTTTAWDDTKAFMASDAGGAVVQGGANILAGLLAGSDGEVYGGGQAGSGAMDTFNSYINSVTNVTPNSKLTIGANKYFGGR
jgi:hypothetical protein